MGVRPISFPSVHYYPVTRAVADASRGRDVLDHLALDPQTKSILLYARGGSEQPELR